MNNTEYILTGSLHTIVCAFIDSQSTDTVTVEVIRVSDGYKWNFTTLAFTSTGTVGAMANIAGTEAWQSSFTPATPDTYIITATDTTLDIKDTMMRVAKGTIPTDATGSSTYCVKADILGLGSGFEIPSTWTDEAINQQIIECESEVNAYLDSDFSGPKTLTLIADGPGNKLMQTRRYTNLPIISITSITCRDSLEMDWSAGTVWASTDFYADKFYIEAAGEYVNSIRYSTRSKFVKGIRNYRIIGSFGYATVPSYVKLLTVLLVREKIVPGYLTKLDITSESWSDYKVAYGNTKKDMPSIITGFPVLDAIIGSHKNKSLFLEVV